MHYKLCSLLGDSVDAQEPPRGNSEEEQLDALLRDLNNNH